MWRWESCTTFRISVRLRNAWLPCFMNAHTVLPIFCVYVGLRVSFFFRLSNKLLPLNFYQVRNESSCMKIFTQKRENYPVHIKNSHLNVFDTATVFSMCPWKYTEYEVIYYWHTIQKKRYCKCKPWFGESRHVVNDK